MKVKDGDAWIRVMKDGVVYHYSGSQYAAEFGHTPVKPKEGEALFGGRYSHRTFANVLTAEGTPATQAQHANTGSFDLNAEAHSVTD